MFGFFMNNMFDFFLKLGSEEEKNSTSIVWTIGCSWRNAQETHIKPLCFNILHAQNHLLQEEYSLDKTCEFILGAQSKTQRKIRWRRRRPKNGYR